MKKQNWIMIGAIAGAKAVVLGAFGAHLLKNLLETHQKLNVYETAVKYHFYHAFAILIIGILIKLFPTLQNVLQKVGFMFLIGIIIFSGSLYVLSVTNLAWIGAITPVGGALLIVSWAWLAWVFKNIKL